MSAKGLYVLAPDKNGILYCADFIPALKDNRNRYYHNIRRLYGPEAFIQGLKSNAHERIGTRLNP